jgi:DNA-binding transcriptional MerR regulator
VYDQEVMALVNIKNELMSIGQVARAAGVATTTLRYYEREGVLIPTGRSAAGYRLYDGQAVEQLTFIRSAQAVGFTLEDIHMLLDLDGAQKSNNKKEVQALIEKRLVDVEQKMNDLKRVSAALRNAREKCLQADGACPVIKELRTQGKKKKTCSEVKSCNQ